jgi:hypothetical protein
MASEIVVGIDFGTTLVPARGGWSEDKNRLTVSVTPEFHGL